MPNGVPQVARVAQHGHDRAERGRREGDGDEGRRGRHGRRTCTAMPNAAASEMIQPIAARVIGRPRIAAKSISLPARKKSIASPNSERNDEEVVGDDPAEDGRSEQQAEQDLEHDERDRHHAAECAHEQRRRDRDGRDEHQRADRDVHVAPPGSGAAIRACRDASGARPRRPRSRNAARPVFRARNTPAVSSRDARPAGENHRRTQCQPGHRPRRAGACSDRLPEGVPSHDRRARVRARHQRRPGLHARRAPLPAGGRGARSPRATLRGSSRCDCPTACSATRPTRRSPSSFIQPQETVVFNIQGGGRRARARSTSTRPG